MWEAAAPSGMPLNSSSRRADSGAKSSPDTRYPSVPPLRYDVDVLKRKLLSLLFAAMLVGQVLFAADQHLLYVASPGTRNYVEYGGVGILVFDIDHGYKFVRRIPTWTAGAGSASENAQE